MCFPLTFRKAKLGIWACYQFMRTDLRKRDGSLRLAVYMKNLPFKLVLVGEIEITASKLPVVYNNYALEHMVVKSLRHSIKGSNILIQSADDVEIRAISEVSS